MYRRSSNGFFKHIDFAIMDVLMAEVAFFAAYLLRHKGIFYGISYYRRVAWLLIVVEVCVALFQNEYAGILKRSALKEFGACVKHSVAVSFVLIVLLYLQRMAGPLSRLTVFGLAGFYLVLSYIMRLILKKAVIKGREANPDRSIILLTTSTRARETVKRFKENRKYGFRIAGLILYDRDGRGEEFEGVPVVASIQDADEYICRNWVDELYAGLPEGIAIPGKLFTACMSMGVTIHQKMSYDNYESIYGCEQFLERIAGVTCVTTAIKTVSWVQAALKRVMDILGGLVGTIFTLILTIFIGPAIYLKSPGPIFFKQERIGQNGRKIRIYKFRSMYMDAEERKKELMEQNKIKDGMMFKMDDDPRIIKGVGHFIRNHSIDEFPQFFNVLNGTMSLVGTRPPTVDEWEKYDLHHRVRMAVKPGITGMWQVNGRSSITDFEKVVALDEEYIRTWSFLLDLKIILKTVKVMFTKDGAS